jgi:hypothetical protein
VEVDVAHVDVMVFETTSRCVPLSRLMDEPLLVSTNPADVKVVVIGPAVSVLPEIIMVEPDAKIAVTHIGVR